MKSSASELGLSVINIHDMNIKKKCNIKHGATVLVYTLPSSLNGVFLLVAR